MTPRERLSEGRLLFLIGAVQFVNILDFMMVMPLGPDFSRELSIPTSNLGIIGGSYTAAAAISGIAGASFLDRFDRRSALSGALLGLVTATALGGLATGLYSLIAARVLAGVFGGPATSLALAIVADVVPLERRGRAMGAVMGAFSVASVLGVPMGLQLAQWGGWRAPFFAVAALGLAVVLGGYSMLPSLTGHLGHEKPQPGAVLAMLRRPLVLLAYTATAMAMFGNFVLIPNLSTYFQLNRGFPRDQLWGLYAMGGAASFLTLRLAGFLSDRLGPARVAAIGSSLFVTILWAGFIQPAAWLPIMGIFVGFMVTSSFRMVPMQALGSRIPAPSERARYMSVQSCVQHLASSGGAILSSHMLTANADGSLVGIDKLATLTAVVAALMPLVLFAVESRVRVKESVAAKWAAAQKRPGAPAADVSS